MITGLMRVGKRFALFALLFLTFAVVRPAWALTNVSLKVSDIRNNSATSATFTLSWSPASNGYSRYLFEWNPNGVLTLLYNGNAATPVTLTRTVTGAWRYRVLFGFRASNGQIQVTGQSNDATVNVPTPKTPTLLGLPRSPLDNGFRLQWTNDPGNFIYQLAEDTRSNFSTPNAPQYWPKVNEENIPNKAPGLYYYRVRAWNKLPENGGKSSAWSNVIQVNVLSNEQFLDTLAKRTFDYLVATTNSNGLTLDRLATDGTPSTVTSIASTGFYLSGLTVGAQRGWMTRTAAYDRAKKTLQTFQSKTPNVHGFFYHFLKPDAMPSAQPFLEVSALDTAILVAGALQAGEYFGGDVKTLADMIYRRVEWNWMYDANLNQMRQAWNETGGFQGYYNSYSEAILLYLLGIGAPVYSIPADSFYSFARPKGSYRGPDFIFTPGGEIFTYQFPQAYFDFRNTTDQLGVNWWQNSIEGVRANQRYAIDSPGLGYSQYYWGLTACDGPDGYKAYGARPAYYNISDGTLAPTGIAASIPLAEDIALPALKQIYKEQGDRIWKTYGFVDAFNRNRNWVDNWYIGIDQGIILLMLENRKSQLVWRTFMQNQYVVKALSRAKFSGYSGAAPDVTLDDFEDGDFATPDTSAGWWDIDGTAVYQRANSFSTFYDGRVGMRVDYSKNGKPYSYVGAHFSTANPKRDFSQHELLSVNVYGACELLVKLRDQSQAEQDVAVLKAANPLGWNHLVCDFSGVTLNKAAIDNVLFFVDPGNGASQGTVYLDTMKLENRKPAVLDHFEDASFWTPDTSLGWWDIDGTRVYRRSQTKDPSHSGWGAMKVEYTKDGLAWALFGGSLSPANPLKDFTQHTRLVFWVYGQADILVKLRDRTLREAELGTAHAVNGNGWTRVVFNYSGVRSINLSDIDNILFFVAPGNSSASGTIYLDDISVE